MNEEEKRKLLERIGKICADIVFLERDLRTNNKEDVALVVAKAYDTLQNAYSFLEQ